MFEFIGLLIWVAVVIAGFSGARRFVRERLRFVDAAQHWSAPWIAGAAAAAIAVPAVWLLPLVGTGTALAFGASVGAGVALGAKDIRRGTSYQVTSGS